MKFLPLGSLPKKQPEFSKHVYLKPTDVLVDVLVTQMLETEAVCEGLADTLESEDDDTDDDDDDDTDLESEGGAHIPQRQSLPIHCADGDGPVTFTVLDF